MCALKYDTFLPSESSIMVCSIKEDLILSKYISLKALRKRLIGYKRLLADVFSI
ncbi:MAG: hypothetical protein LBD73_00480 [Deferribacteraceae bacterium]|nr:hypothetical protein [Deferribacteraceae bacterium]